MISGSCHCGAISFELCGKPEWLSRCNCSYCRRAGWLIAHADISKVQVTYDPDNVIRYMHGDHTLAFVSCKICGCTTHWESADLEKHPRMAVNCLMADPDTIKDFRIRHFDGADNWQYQD